MLKDRENSRKQGDVGLGAAISWFTSLGYTTCIPLTDSQKYDLVVDIDNELKRIQIKTTYYKRDGKYEVMIKTCGGNKNNNSMHTFDNTASDYLFILTESGAKYLIPTSQITAKHGIVLGDKYKEHILN